jgi:hypothetical protein
VTGLRRHANAGGATQLQVSVTLDPVPNKPIEKTLALVGPR